MPVSRKPASRRRVTEFRTPCAARALLKHDVCQTGATDPLALPGARVRHREWIPRDPNRSAGCRGDSRPHTGDEGFAAGQGHHPQQTLSGGALHDLAKHRRVHVRALVGLAFEPAVGATVLAAGGQVKSTTQRCPRHAATARRPGRRGGYVRQRFHNAMHSSRLGGQGYAVVAVEDRLSQLVIVAPGQQQPPVAVQRQPATLGHRLPHRHATESTRMAHRTRHEHAVWPVRILAAGHQLKQ